MALEETREKIMPYYEYECEFCGNVIEKFWPSIPKTIPDKVAVVCEPCGDIWSKKSHKRIMSTPNFHLKGTGWADDGYDHNPNKIVALDEPS